MTNTLTKETARLSGSSWLKEVARQEAEAQVEAGFDSPLELYIDAKLAAVQAEGKIDGLKRAAIEEAMRYGEKSFVLGPATVSRTRVGGSGKTDYSGDPEWRRLKSLLGEWEATLQALTQPEAVVTCEGEQYIAHPLPPKAGSYESISISFNAPSGS